jgi:DNA-3-methyladenine glycosylase I
MAARPVPEGIVVGSDRTRRCWWGAEPPVYQEYHDTEWGVPVTDDFRLFEKICLEGFQSGLSWLTILKKREAFREVFCGFDFNQVAWFGDLETTVPAGQSKWWRSSGRWLATSGTGNPPPKAARANSTKPR